MADEPIDKMITKAVRCPLCDAPYGECDCWEDIVRLRCPECSREMMTVRDQTDPPGTAVVVVLCDWCDRGEGFPETHYYDIHGHWFNGEKFVDD